MLVPILIGIASVALILAAILWKLIKWWKEEPNPVAILKKVGYLFIGLVGAIGCLYFILVCICGFNNVLAAVLCVFLLFALFIIGVKVLNSSSDEICSALIAVGKIVGLFIGLCAVVGVYVHWVKPAVVEMQEGLTYDPMKAPPKNMKQVETPQSFCGVEFGDQIDQSGQFSPQKVDRGLDRSGFSNMQRSGSGQHERSYWESSYSPAIPFRGFKDGNVKACYSSKKIYSVSFVYSLPRNRATAADEAEFKAASDAISKKYGVDPISDSRVGGDRINIFWIGDVRVTLYWQTEGTWDRAELRLEACHMGLDSKAEQESVAYYEKLMREARSQVNEGGADAL